METTKKYTLLKKIVVTILLIASILVIHQSSNAVEVETKYSNEEGQEDLVKVFDKTTMMPEKNLAGGSGMLPQYYGLSSIRRKVTLDDARLLFKTNSWKATAKGEIVFCAQYGAYVRYGKNDVDNKHYLKPSGTTIQGATIPLNGFTTIQTVKDGVYETLKRAAEEEAKLETGYVEGSFTTANRGTVPSPSDAIGYLVLRTQVPGASSSDIIGHAERQSKSIMEKFMEKLGKEVWPGKYSASIDGDENYTSPLITATEGPEIVVMEQGDGGANAKSGYVEGKGTTYENNKKAFIFSACENAYGSKDYATKYAITDIQGAYWKILAKDEKGTEPTTHLTKNATELYNKAEEYVKFGGKFTASIDDSKAQVIVDRDKKEYVAGPYSITYTNFEDISYMKGIIIDNNENLLYDESHDGIEIILEGGKGTGTKVPGSNGVEKEYPRSNQNFFIKFSAEKAGYPETVTLDAKFEYINSTKATVKTELKANANIYKYYGYCQTEGAYAMDKSSSKFRFEWQIEKDKTDSNGVVEKDPTTGENVKVREDRYREYDYDIYMPYVKMKSDYRVGDAQELTVISEAEREYKVVGLGTPPKIDLTMELGGYVWTDENGGKNSKPNGTYDETVKEEQRVPNVKVTLYQEGGKEIATTKTDENGEYRFTKLNSMFQYYVKFTYNGQYYQPTLYEDSSTWGKENWAINSNAKDIKQERVNFNLKFEKIGSSPANYKSTNGYNETFSKMQLLGYTLQTNGEYKKTKEAVIDEFGNLILENSSNAETRKMIQYVKDCMMDAYTTADGQKGLYPVPSVFVIDEKAVPLKYKQLINKNPKELYPNAYYINLGLNPREEADLAITKDVDHVDLEINGQTHRYTYDTLDKFHCNTCGYEGKNEELQLEVNNGGLSEYQEPKCPKCGSLDIKAIWDIDVRVSDVYYNTNYTREIYKSDYIYKSSMYGDKDENGDNIGDVYGKTKDDELKVYITYKIMVRNQALSIQSKVDEIVDYYDEDLSYVDNRSYIRVRNKEGKYITQPVEAMQNVQGELKPKGSKYANIPGTTTTINGYNNLYITGLEKVNGENKYLESGEIAYVYLTFEVKKDNKNGEDWIKLDEIVANEDLKSMPGKKIGDAIGVGKENIVEINGYSTRYAKGTKIPDVGTKFIDVGETPAGIVDRDSNPGNLNPNDVPKDGPIKYENFEDDTDKAPNIRLVLYKDDEANRVISGIVWEDERTQEIGTTATGDGIREKDKEELINGVTVQLVELLENGTEYVWREFGAPAVALGQEGGIGGINTIGLGKGSGLVDSETPIINYEDLGEEYKVKNYDFDSEHKGQYAFKSFMPGKYVVRFIYGDTIRTVIPNTIEIKDDKGNTTTGENAKSYNGQDYKSTTYQKGIPDTDENGNNKIVTYTWREKPTWNAGQEKPIEGQELTQISTFKDDASNNETATPLRDENGYYCYRKGTNVEIKTQEQQGYLYDIATSDKFDNRSDAKDIESIRKEVIDYSNENVNNYIAEVLASHREEFTPLNNNRKELLDNLIANTKMTAETGVMVIELEYNATGTNGQTKSNQYKIQNVDLGLEERPKAQIAINKEVTNVKLTLANGSILFDAQGPASNVLWRKHDTYEDNINYKGNLVNTSEYESVMGKIRNDKATTFGLIQLTMDEELMHGATIEITYQVKVSNVGEVDYKDNKFYYTGNKSENAQVVTTRVDQVIDYVANNLQFNKQNNNDWDVIELETIQSQEQNERLVNQKLDEELEKYNTMIITKGLAKDLVPKLYKEQNEASKKNENEQYSTSVPLVLTQLITSENSTDDLTYRNIVEIVTTSNTVGRRMEYSVVGNQNPTEAPQELDSDSAHTVRILPPFGNNGIHIIVTLISLASIAILVGGAIFIKKKVLRK